MSQDFSSDEISMDNKIAVQNSQSIFVRFMVIMVAICGTGLMALAVSTLSQSNRDLKHTSFKSSRNTDEFKLDSTSFFAPISMRSDVSDSSSYLAVFLSKFGLNVPDSAKKSKKSSTSESSATGWVYVSVYNESICGTTSAEVIGGMLCGTCVNKDSDASYKISCDGEEINVYQYSATDCSSAYTTKTISKGCQTADFSSVDDWIILDGPFDDTDDAITWSFDFQTSTSTSLPLSGSYAVYESFFTGNDDDDGSCTSPVMFEAWPLDSCKECRSDGSGVSWMFYDDAGSLEFCEWDEYYCPTSCENSRSISLTCSFETDGVGGKWSMGAY